MEQWQRRNRALSGIIYWAEGKAGISKGMWTDGLQASSPVPAEDYVADVTLTVTFDMSGRVAKRATQILYNSVSKQVELQHYVNLFDGSAFQTYVPRDKNRQLGVIRDKYFPDIRTMEPDALEKFFEPNDLPLLMSIGVMPKPGRYPSPSEFRANTDRAELIFTSTGAINGREHSVIRSRAFGAADTFYEYWVDAKREGAVSRHILYGKGNPVFQCDIDYAEQNGLWLVEKWKSVRFRGREIEGWYEFAVTKRELNPQFSLEEFHVEPTAGLIVQDDKSGRIVRKGGGGNPDEDVRTLIARDNAGGTSIIWGWLLIACIVIVVALAIRFRKSMTSRTF